MPRRCLPTAAGLDRVSDGCGGVRRFRSDSEVTELRLNETWNETAVWVSDRVHRPRASFLFRLSLLPCVVAADRSLCQLVEGPPWSSPAISEPVRVRCFFFSFLFLGFVLLFSIEFPGCRQLTPSCEGDGRDLHHDLVINVCLICIVCARTRGTLSPSSTNIDPEDSRHGILIYCLIGVSSRRF